MDYQIWRRICQSDGTDWAQQHRMEVRARLSFYEPVQGNYHAEGLLEREGPNLVTAGDSVDDGSELPVINRPKVGRLDRMIEEQVPVTSKGLKTSSVLLLQPGSFEING